MFLDFWTKDIISALPVAFIMSIFYMFVQFFGPRKKTRLFYLLTLIAMLGGAWLTRLRLGSYDNVLIPAYAGLSILFGLGTHEGFRLIRAASANKRRWVEISVYAVCIVQFLILTYNPRRQVPTKRDLEAGRVLIATMAEVPGEVLIPYHGYLPRLAGKRSHAHHQAISDILVGGDGPVKDRLFDQISRAIRERRFDALISDAPWFPELTEKYYKRERMLFADPDVFWTVTGMRTNPQIIYVPRTTDDD